MMIAIAGNSAARSCWIGRQTIGRTKIEIAFRNLKLTH
jgi:hypothetical protein